MTTRESVDALAGWHRPVDNNVANMSGTKGNEETIECLRAYWDVHIAGEQAVAFISCQARAIANRAEPDWPGNTVPAEDCTEHGSTVSGATRSGQQCGTCEASAEESSEEDVSEEALEAGVVASVFLP